MLKSNRGFSLVELLIVVAVIGTLSAIAVPKYTQYKAKSRRAECLSTAASISKVSATMMARTDAAPCSLSNTSSANSPAYSAGNRCAGRIKFPVSDIAATDNAKFYYVYNVSPGGRNLGNTATNWYPNTTTGRPNKLNVAFSATGVNTAGRYPASEDYVVTCAGRVYTSNTTMDDIKILSSGNAVLWSDNVTGFSTTSSATAKIIK